MNPDLALQIIPELLHGTWITVNLVAQSTLLGFALIAVPLGLARNSKRRALRILSSVYDFVFRGTPLIVLLYIVYYGLATWSPIRDSVLWVVFQEPYFCALLALSLNTGAYGAEIVQGAIRSVPKEQIESAQALALKRRHVLLFVSGPLALRYALAPYTHEIIGLIKSTAVVSTITILDLMGTASSIYTETFDAFTPMLSAGVVYLALVLLLTAGMGRVERWLYRGNAGVAAASQEVSGRDAI